MELYPQGPTAVPADLTSPTRAYKLHAWLAVGGLLLFVALYLGLTCWFGLTAYRLLRDAFDAGGGKAFGGVLLALPPAFFCAFLIGGLFGVKHGRPPTELEITARDEPELFAFIHRIAKEAGAPKAHRVFLSPRVNAAVFYDLSVLNLIFPSKKNLEIGLGLVNCLTLAELKAVIAHEFGHFAQDAMAVGRWVYIAEQIAGHVVAKRGMFDRFLNGLSRVDIRIAWLGWLMQLLVWSIRAVLDTAFRVVILARSALSREMELQADLVSVSLAGSDGLVHALHKLHAADDAYARACAIVDGELAHDRPVEDLFAVQSKVLVSVREITDDPHYGQVPALPAAGREQHRVFRERFAQPPKMWATHPPSREREDNAKRRYVSAALDDREAWVLFADPQATRKRVTRRLLEAASKQAVGEPAPLSTTLEQVSEQFGRAFFDRRYRGRYLGRSVVIDSKTTRELYADPEDPARAPIALDALYPKTLSDELERHRELEEEHATLRALQDGVLTAPGRLIKHRGKEIKRRDLARTIAQVDGERAAARQRILAHDRACRSAHRAAARALGQGWEEHLAGLLALLHYADHSEANVGDAASHLNHVLAIVTADGKVSKSELERLTASAADLHTTMWQVLQQRDAVVLPEPIARRMKVERWSEALPKQALLDSPTPQNMAGWLNAIGSWIAGIRGPLDKLSSTALELLLEVEDYVADCVRTGRDPGPAPAAARIPAKYDTVVPGAERPRQKRMDFWDRFQTADGIVPSTLRLLVAVAILGAALAFGGTVTDASVQIYNGLGVPVTVSIGGVSAGVAPFGHTEMMLPPSAHAHVEARTGRAGALVEAFDADAHNNRMQYVYNVAGASPLVEWTAVYGPINAPKPRRLGAPRWLTTRADVLFTEPPKSVSTHGGSDTRDVLQGFGEESVTVQLTLLDKPEDAAAAIAAHARWDDVKSEMGLQWLGAAVRLPAFSQIVAARLHAAPRDVALLRFEQDASEGAAHASVCARHKALSEQAKDDLDLLYLANRCIADKLARNSAMLDAYAAHPEHGWSALGAGYALAGRGDWTEASAAMDTVLAKLPSLAAGIGGEVARIRRVVAPTPDEARLDDLAKHSYEVRQLLSFEPSSEAQQDSLRAFQLLARGELDKALYAARKDKGLRPVILRLAAASDGASAEITAEAQALPPDAGLGLTTLWTTLALAARDGADQTPYLELVRHDAGDDADVMLSWADRGKLRTQREQLERELSVLAPSERGAARLMGVLVLGTEAPDVWWREVNALLFSSERPFLTRLAQQPAHE